MILFEIKKKRDPRLDIIQGPLLAESGRPAGVRLNAGL
jgi:hypothetical protein